MLSHFNVTTSTSTSDADMRSYVVTAIEAHFETGATAANWSVQVDALAGLSFQVCPVTHTAGFAALHYSSDILYVRLPGRTCDNAFADLLLPVHLVLKQQSVAHMPAGVRSFPLCRWSSPSLAQASLSTQQSRQAACLTQTLTAQPATPSSALSKTRCAAKPTSCACIC